MTERRTIRVAASPNVGRRAGRRRGAGSAAACLLVALGGAGEGLAAPSGNDPGVRSAAGTASAAAWLEEARALAPSDEDGQVVPANRSGTFGVAGAASPPTNRPAAPPAVGAAAGEAAEPGGAAAPSQAGGQVAGDQTRVAYRPVPGSDAGTGGSIEPDQLLSLYQDGAGQASTSMDELDLVLGRRQIFTDLRTLETRLNNQQRPTFNVVDRNSTQTDRLDINQLEVSQDLYFSQGRDSVRLGVQRIAFDAPGDDDVTQYAAGLTGNVKLSDFAAIAGEFWVNRLQYRRAADDTLVTYDVFVTLRPSDVIRIDIDTSRRTFDNIRSLRLGLTAQSYGGSIDYTPTDRLRLTARGFGAAYDDANRRRNEEVEVVWRAKTTPLVEIGVRGTNFHFTRLLDNGYFNPRDYVSGEALFRVQSELTRKLTVELAGSGGAEKASPGGVKPLIKGSLQAVYRLENGWSIDAEAAHFTSRDSSSSGFARTSFTLGLHYRF